MILKFSFTVYTARIRKTYWLDYTIIDFLFNCSAGKRHSVILCFTWGIRMQFTLSTLPLRHSIHYTHSIFSHYSISAINLYHLIH